MKYSDTWKKILCEERPIVLNKINIAERNGNHKKAIKILEGFLQRHPYANDINILLGQRYFDQNDLQNAGRRWYFVENKNENQLSAVVEFERKHGYDPLLILKTLFKGLQAGHMAFADIYERNYKIKLLDKYTITELLRLTNLTIEKHRVIPHFIQDFIELTKVEKIGSS